MARRISENSSVQIFFNLFLSQKQLNKNEYLTILVQKCIIKVYNVLM